MSLSQTLTRRRDADLLQRAVDGDPRALAHPLLADGGASGLDGREPASGKPGIE